MKRGTRGRKVAPTHHVPSVDLFLFFSPFLVVLVASRSTQQPFKAKRSNRDPSRLHCFAPLILSLLSLSFILQYTSGFALSLSLTDIKTLPRGSRTHLHLSLFSTPFICLYMLYSITITGTSEVAISRSSAHAVFKIALRLVDGGIPTTISDPILPSFLVQKCLLRPR